MTAMRPEREVAHCFVDYIPEDLEDGTVYVSVQFATAVHKCCCGCGREVVTPLSPTDWKLIFEGQTISLHPSIGNWSFPCQSHYWIRRNRVVWAPRWSRSQIEAGRADDRAAKQAFFGGSPDTTRTTTPTPRGRNIWSRIKGWFS
jgi:uncharacterized protein DUF6527